MKSAQESVFSTTEMEAKVKNERMFGHVDADLLILSAFLRLFECLLYYSIHNQCHDFKLIHV